MLSELDAISGERTLLGENLTGENFVFFVLTSSLNSVKVRGGLVGAGAALSEDAVFVVSIDAIGFGGCHTFFTGFSSGL